MSFLFVYLQDCQVSDNKMRDEREALYRERCHYTTDTEDVSSTIDGEDTPNNNLENSRNSTESNKEHSSWWTLLQGHLYGVLMAVGWAASASCSQALGGYVPAFQLNMMRLGCELLLVADFLFYQKDNK